MNYLIPVNKLLLYGTQKQKDMQFEYRKESLENIISQQILISQMSNGITYKDTEDMDEYERVFVLKKLIALKKEEIEAKREAMKNAQN